MRSRPALKTYQLHHNATPIIAISPQGNLHLYASVRAASLDIDSLGSTKTRTMQRRVSEGGGNVGGWYLTAL